MAVFKKQGIFWIEYHVNGRRKRERIGADKRLTKHIHGQTAKGRRNRCGGVTHM